MRGLRTIRRYIRDAAKSVIRNFALSLASISCIAITLIVVSFSIIISYNVDNFTETIRKDVTMVIFLDKTSNQADYTRIESEIRKTGNVETLIFKSKQQSAEETAKFINSVISNSCKSKVSFVIKHFPGYGNNEDTHFGLVVDKRGLEEILQKDMIPFVKGVKAGADSIMVSHNIVAVIDKNNPASLSKQVHEFAREKLGFTGILMTDNIDMEAIRRYTSNTGIVDAVLAGNDIVMISDYKKCTEE